MIVSLFTESTDRINKILQNTHTHTHTHTHARTHARTQRAQKENPDRHQGSHYLVSASAVSHHVKFIEREE